MKKILLLIFVLMGLEFNVEAQANLTYQTFDSLNFGSVIQMVDFRGSKIVVDGNSAFHKLDTVTGIFKSFVIPNKSNTCGLIGVDRINNLVIINADTLLFFNNTIWKKYLIPTSNFSNIIIDSSNSVIGYDYSTNLIYTLHNNSWSTRLIILHNYEHFSNFLLGAKNELVMQTQNKFSSSQYLYKIVGTNKFLVDSFTNYFDQYLIDSFSNIWYRNYFMQSLVKRLPNHFEISYNSSNSLLPNTFTNFFQINKNGRDVWFGGWNGYLYYFNFTSLDSVAWDGSYFYQGGQEIFIDRNSVVKKYRKLNYKQSYSKSFSAFSKSFCIKNYAFNSSFLLGTDSGIYYLNQGAAVQFCYSNALIPNNIFCFSSYNQNNNWSGQADSTYIGTDSGMYTLQINNSTCKTFNHINQANNGIASDSISYIFHDSNNWNSTNAFWLGTFSKGLSIYKYGSNTLNYNSTNSTLPSNHINAIMKSEFDTLLFICTDSGFTVASSISFRLLKTFTPHNSGLNHPDVRFVKGFLLNNKISGWVGTMGGGLNIFDTSSIFQYYNKSNSNFPSDSLTYIFEDYQNLWNNPLSSMIGTSDIGILSSKNLFADIQNNSLTQTNLFQGNNNSSKYYTLNSNLAYSYSIDCFESCCVSFASLNKNGFLSTHGCWGGINNTIQSNSEFITYLNSNALNIKWNELKQGNAIIQLYDVLGRKVFERSVFADDNFCNTEIPELTSALYFVKVQQKEKSHAGKISFVK